MRKIPKVIKLHKKLKDEIVDDLSDKIDAIDEIVVCFRVKNKVYTWYDLEDKYQIVGMLNEMIHEALDRKD
jgi:hypothetical protein